MNTWLRALPLIAIISAGILVLVFYSYDREEQKKLEKILSQKWLGYKDKLLNSKLDFYIEDKNQEIEKIMTNLYNTLSPAMQLVFGRNRDAEQEDIEENIKTLQRLQETQKKLLKIDGIKNKHKTLTPLRESMLSYLLNGTQ